VFDDVAPTTKMPAIKSKARSSSGVGFRGRWRGFRQSLYAAVRSSGAWFLAVCVGVLAVSLSWVGWLMEKVSSAVVEAAELGGRSVQVTLPVEEGDIWVWLAQVHAAWFVAVPAVVWFLVVVIKEVK